MMELTIFPYNLPPVPPITIDANIVYPMAHANGTYLTFYKKTTKKVKNKEVTEDVQVAVYGIARDSNFTITTK